MRSLVLAALLAAAAASPVAAQGANTSQLAASVQHRLNTLGFGDVDARTLSTRQLGALHLKLQGPVFGGVGLNNRWIRKRAEVQSILGWEAEGRPSR
ncbi:hypothetical protein [Jannaschia sp. W003]|uniref:hypothetical protein n=1 Tax=Jannaschia sp. W003 TaxID=2867012 RepID=UPI0021A76321|nr:hypothetical protein [Jannaschia sp. W003]UWQ22319.1 hypothetical protein K3554_04600 [Jannaschia sp. W003]